MNKQTRSKGHPRVALRMGGAVAAVLVLSAVFGVPAASAAPVASVSIISTGTGSEDHFTPNVLDPGDELSPNDAFVRTLDATRVNLSYTPDSGGSTNLVLTATISTTNAGWDLRGANYATGNNPPCPGGVSTPQRNVLVCNVGTASGSSPISFDPVMRVSALAGHNLAFRVDVTVSDSNGSSTAVSPDVFTSAAPRFDLEKTMGSPIQTPNTLINEGTYVLKIGDADPLGISALGNTVTFTDHVDVKSRITRCDDTTPVTFPGQPVPNPDGQWTEVVGTCNGAPFSPTPNTGLGNGQDNVVTMAGIDWDRIYPPPLVANGVSDATTGWVVASMQYFMETDKVDVELGDGIPNNNVGTLLVGNAIGMTGYNSATDTATGPSVWSPVDVNGNPNLGSDDTPGEDDLGDNTAGWPHNIYLDARSGKYISEITVDGQRVATTLAATDASQGVSWPNQIDLCDKFDNRREHIVQAPNSTEAVVNLTLPNAPVFANAVVEYGRSAGWGPGAGPTGAQWWNMSQSGCDAADTVGGFFTSNQVDWTNSNLLSINAEDVNMVRYRPAGPFLHPQNNTGTYFVDVHFQVADNDAGDYIVDFSSYDPDGPGGASTWDTSSCNGGTPGTCPDPPELSLNNSYYRPGPVSSGVMVHVDSHPRIVKDVVDPPSASGTTPVDFRYELRLGNTRVAGDTTPRQDFTVQDVLPPELDFQVGSEQVVSNGAGLTITGPVVTTQSGSDVLTWTVSGLTLDVDPADMPVIQYVASADVFTPSSGPGGYINRATIAGPGIDGAVNAAWSPNSTISADGFLGLSDPGPGNLPRSTWGLFDEARVVVNGQGRVIMSKDLDAATSEPGDTYHYSLIYGNSGSDIEQMDAYDVFPFDGDGSRGSTMHGTMELVSATEDPNSNVEIWISDVAPATLDALDAGSGSPVPGGINPTAPGLPATGSATWPCQVQNAGQPGCPALSAVTAIRVVGADPNPTAVGGTDSFLPTGTGPFTIDLAVRTLNGRGADELVNSWSALYLPITTPATATAPVHTLLEGAVGDRVFEDVNANGVFDTGDVGLANVTVDVFDASNTVVGTDQTDADGRWLVENLRPGDYRVRIPSTEFDPGAVLEDYEAASGAASDPDADVDEAGDHDAHAVAGGIEAGGRVTLTYGAEPLMDDIGSLSFLTDGDSNFTVDFALVPVEDPPPPPPPSSTTTTISTTSTTSVARPPRQGRTPPGSLPRTGWGSLVWIVVGGSLVLGGAMVISRRQDRRA